MRFVPCVLILVAVVGLVELRGEGRHVPPRPDAVVSETDDGIRIRALEARENATELNDYLAARGLGIRVWPIAAPAPAWEGRWVRGFVESENDAQDPTALSAARNALSRALAERPSEIEIPMGQSELSFSLWYGVPEGGKDPFIPDAWNEFSKGGMLQCVRVTELDVRALDQRLRGLGLTTEWTLLRTVEPSATPGGLSEGSSEPLDPRTAPDGLVVLYGLLKSSTQIEVWVAPPGDFEARKRQERPYSYETCA